MISLANRRACLALLALGLSSIGCAGGTDTATDEANPEGADTKGEVSTAELPLNSLYGTIDKVPWVMNGDADLYTQNGRQTDVQLYTHYLRLDPGNKAIFWVELSLQETFWPDQSRIYFAGEVSTQVPLNWTVQSISCADSWDTGSIYDKSWDFKPFAVAPNTCIYNASIRVDGNGPDNTGNAQAKLWFNPTIVH